ncbi:hypothetical protein QJQ45_019041, partial [Haematococcus lacustris]
MQAAGRVTLVKVTSGLQANRITAVVLSASYDGLRVKLPRFLQTANAVPSLTAETFTSITVTVQNSTALSSSQWPSTTSSFRFAATFTPRVQLLTKPLLPGPMTAGMTLSLNWTLAQGSAVGVPLPSLASLSNAFVELQSGPDLFTCSTPTVASRALTNNSYAESVSCSLPPYLPAANYTVWVCLEPFGCGYSSQTLTVPLVLTSLSPVSGSAAGGRSIIIQGSGFDSNTSNVQVFLGNAPCNVTEITPASVTCLTTALPEGFPAADTARNLSMQPSRGAALIFSNLTFTYSVALTPRMTSVTPTRGSSAGGTLLSIRGSAFPTNATASAVSVFIGQLPCTSPTVVNASLVRCITSAPPVLGKPSSALPLTVNFAGYGNAWSQGADSSAVLYQYVDLWSRATTWGGNPPPVAGDSVYIPPNVTVLLDVSTPVLGAVVLDGSLTFDDNNSTEIQLQANYILVKGGNLTIGTPASPYLGRARITLHGPPYSRELPQYGAKTIAVRYGNVVMCGAPKVPTWTQLAATADVGDTQLVLAGNVNWVPGDAIAVASSSFYATHTDEAVITLVSYDPSTNTSLLKLDTAMRYTHLGVIVPPTPGDPYNRTIDMRAEVAVLSRRIVIEGDDIDSERWLYGGQIMVNTPRSSPVRAQLQLEQVELRRMGQAFRLGRYSIHWHMHGNVAYNSWLKGVSIHHTYNRAATIHGTHNVLTQNCVAYNNMGHAFFLEDGIEQGNIYDGNLGFLTQRSDSMLVTDTTPATFWVTHPANTYINNHAGGSTDGYGFWYRFLQNPEGPSATGNVCPKYTPMGAFINNTAHSSMFYGLRIHPEYQPMLNPCGSQPDQGGLFQQVPATFDGLVSYKNGMKGAIGTQLGAVRFANMTLADNGAGPRQHVTNGKDNGANWELTWVVDDRSRYETRVEDMAGLFDSLVVARTVEGQRGTAGVWPSGRKITGVILHSMAEFHVKHTALAAMVNVTFVGYSANNGQFQGALE